MKFQKGFYKPASHNNMVFRKITVILESIYYEKILHTFETFIILSFKKIFVIHPLIVFAWNFNMFNYGLSSKIYNIDREVIKHNSSYQGTSIFWHTVHMYGLDTLFPLLATKSVKNDL